MNREEAIKRIYEIFYNDSKYKDRIKFAKTIDNVDMFLGPFTSAMKLSGSESLEYFGWVIDLTELSAKAFFGLIYAYESKNYSALLDWIPREIFAKSLPYGGLLNIPRSYERIVKEDYDRRIKDRINGKISFEEVIQ